MGEIEKYSKEEKEDMALALSDSGWTYREIAEELGISKNSVKPMKERAEKRIPIPDREDVQRFNLRITNKMIQDMMRRLDDPNLPITATNVPNLYREIRNALKQQSDVLGVTGTGARKDDTFGGMTLVQWFQSDPEATHNMFAQLSLEDEKRHDAWMARGDEDLNLTDFEEDPYDGVYKLRSEFKENDVQEDYT